MLGGDPGRFSQRDLGQMVGNWPDTPVVLLHDRREQRCDHLFLVDDLDRAALAWAARRFRDPAVRAAMDEHVERVVRAAERAEGAQETRSMWDRRWVRISAVVGALTALLLTVAQLVEVAVLLGRHG